MLASLLLPQLATGFHISLYQSCVDVYTRRLPFSQFLRSSILAFAASRPRLCFQDPSASDSTVRPHIISNRSSSYSTSRPRHSTSHQSFCAVQNRFIMNTRQLCRNSPPSSLRLPTSAHPHHLLVSFLHIRIQRHTDQDKALSNINTNARGVLRVYLTMVDGDGDSEKKDMTRKIGG